MDTNFEPNLIDAERLDITARLLRWTSIFLAASVWLSSTLFGLYILAFYAGAFADGGMNKWNDMLPRLYEPDSPAATAGIGLHFAAGGIILVLGFVQLLAPVRDRFPMLHRVIGRVYVAAALAAGVGGLIFIAVKGTIGGAVMNIGFSLYGILMIVCAIQTIRYARRGELETHRAWALRLFALAIGSWLYRMDYGFWLMLTGGVGHSRDFHGWFDYVMAFFFYVPNLLVAEAFVRGRRSLSPAFRLLASAVLVGAAGFLILGTYYFTKLYWGPAIVNRIFPT
jgi:uncharacterized membrane protein